MCCCHSGGSLAAFDHGQRQAVDEQHHIRPPVDLPVDDHELLHRQPVVARRHREVQQRHLARRQFTQIRAILAVVLDIHAFDQKRVDAAVFFQQRWQFGLHHAPHSILARLQW